MGGCGSEVILYMEKCRRERLTPNTIMLCVRNTFILDNMRDIRENEYNDIIRASGSAEIRKL